MTVSFSKKNRLCHFVGLFCLSMLGCQKKDRYLSITQYGNYLYGVLQTDSVKKTKCNYIIHKQNVLLQELSYQDWIEDQFLKAQKKERELGFSIVGIHRDDFDIELDGKHLYSFYSRGINNVEFNLKCSHTLLNNKESISFDPIIGIYLQKM